MKAHAGKPSMGMKMKNSKEGKEGPMKKGAYLKTGEGEEEGMESPKEKSRETKEGSPAPSKKMAGISELKKGLTLHEKHNLHGLPMNELSGQDPVHPAAGFVSSKAY